MTKMKCMMKAKKNNVINYNEILSERNSNSYSMSIDIFHYEIQQKWIESYKQFTTSLTNIVSFDDGDFTYLFDYSIELVNAGKISVEECVDARVVVAYGLSKKPVTKRDTSRMKGFLGNFSKLFKNASYDKGHFIGHAIGGNLDVNLFPQLTKINRGWSENGKRFRSMEN